MEREIGKPECKQSFFHSQHSQFHSGTEVFLEKSVRIDEQEDKKGGKEEGKEGEGEGKERKKERRNPTRRLSTACLSNNNDNLVIFHEIENMIFYYGVES